MNRKLVLYSDQEIPENQATDQRLLALIGKSTPMIGYIPSSSDPERFYFNQKRKYYANLGASLAYYFELDRTFNEQDLPKLLSCDAIHLSGGNTFYFLQWLKQRAMLKVLKDYVARGGVMIGVSAGAIIMTPDISTATLCGDEEPEETVDRSALGLVDFQFLPHFEPSIEMTTAISNPPKNYSTTLYACPDGCGIVVDGQNIEIFGDVEKFML
jgi:dipeptidase E